jgi:hypothetical protein
MVRTPRFWTLGVALVLLLAAMAPFQTLAQRQARPRQANFTRLYTSIAGGDLRQVRRRLPPRARVGFLDRVSGRTPLTWTTAARVMNDGIGLTEPARADIAQQLLARGADPLQRDRLDQSAMELAVQGGQDAVVALFLARPAVASAMRGEAGVLALHTVCLPAGSWMPAEDDAVRRVAVARQLLAAGADVSAVRAGPGGDWSSADHCWLYDLDDIARLLNQQGAPTLAYRADGARAR